MKVCLALLGLILCKTAAQAGSTGEHDFFETVGTRFGFGNNRGTRITDFEFFATSRPLRSWDFSREISASLHFETGLGLLSHRSDESFVARAGSVLDVSFGDSPIHFVVSANLAYLSDHRLGSLDLGSDFQFLSAAGFDWRISDRWILGYRWEHISNAGITSLNPGLNLNTLSIGFRF